MTDSSASLQLLAAARSGYLPYTLVKEIANQAARQLPELIDELSHFVASEYAVSAIDFDEASVIVTALWNVCVSAEFWVDHDRTIPPMTNAVYLAFDAGEYHRSSDPAGTDPEVKYTRPMIDAFLAECGQAESNAMRR